MNKVSSITFAITLGLAVNGCSENKSTEQYIEKASTLLASNNVDAAIIELKGAVRKEPKNAVARLRLGEAYLQQGNFNSAEKELEKAHSLGASLEKALPKLASVKAKLGDYVGVKEVLEQATEVEEETLASVLLYAGISATLINRLEEAQDFFSQAVGLDIETPQTQLAEAYLLLTKQNHENSLQIVENVLSDTPDYREALLLKASILYSQQKYKLGNEVLNEYLRITPRDYQTAFNNVNGHIRAGEYDKAELKLSALLKVFSSSAIGNQYKAEIEYQKGDYESAKRNAELSEQQGNQSPFIKILIGFSAYQLGQLEQAYDNLVRVENYFPPSHSVSKVLTIIKVKLGYSDEAVSSIITADSFTDDDTSFLQLASIEMARFGNFEDAQKVISKASIISPNNSRLLAQQGVIKLSNQDKDGIVSFERALELDPNMVEVEFSLGMQYITEGELSKAEKIVARFLENQSSIEYGYVLQGLIGIEKDNYEEAVKSFNNALQVNENSAIALFNLGFLNEASPEVALGYYRRVLEIESAHQGAIQRFTTISAELNKVADAVLFLEGLRKDNPNSFNIILGLAQNYRFSDQLEKAKTLLENIDEQLVLPAGYWVILGDIYTQSREFSKASKSFAEGLRGYPQHYLLNLRLIGSLEMSRELPKALKAAKKADETFPDNPRIKMLLAHLELENKNLEVAKSSVEAFKAKYGNNPFIDRVVGKIAMLERDFATSVESYASVYQHNPNSVNAVLLARALKFNGQQAEAEKALESYLEKDPNNTRIRLLLAELYTEENKEKIFKQYNWLLDKHPKNIVALNNLAWHQHKYQLLDQAIATIEKAYEAKPESLMVLETYGVILIASKKSTEGTAILEKAIAAGSKDVGVYINLAKGYIALNKTQKAKTILSALQEKDHKRDQEIDTLLEQLD